MDPQSGSERDINLMSDWAAERRFFGRFYQSQGFNDKAGFSNDCGPTSLAMVLNLLLFQANPTMSILERESVARQGRLLPWERLPGWVPRVGGATAPWGVVNAFNRLAKRLNLDWRAERRSRARRAHVLECLMTGRPVTVLKIWKTGGAHWVNLVRYTAEKDRLYFLDPNPYLEYLEEDRRLQSQSWGEFEADWTRRSWWSKLLGIRNEMITYTRISGA